MSSRRKEEHSTRPAYDPCQRNGMESETIQSRDNNARREAKIKRGKETCVVYGVWAKRRLVCCSYRSINPLPKVSVDRVGNAMRAHMYVCRMCVVCGISSRQAVNVYLISSLDEEKEEIDP